MKRFTLLLLLISICSFSLSAQILFSEDFEAPTLPTGWTIETLATDNGWNVGTPAAISSQNFGIQSNGSARIIGTNDDQCNCNKSQDVLISPLYDLTNESSVVLKFDSYYTDQAYQGAQENATVEISTDQSNWTVLEDLHGHGSWDQHSVDISAYTGQSIYIAFRYNDENGWLYGFAIDNVILEVPKALEVELVDVESKIFGEINKPFNISGTVLNAGAMTIETMDVTYSIDGMPVDTQTFDMEPILSFNYRNFTFDQTWLPQMEGEFTVEINVISVNDTLDENPDDNSMSFTTDIFGETIVPNKIMDLLTDPPVFEEIATSANNLDRPTDLDFFPVLGKNELWVINQRTENAGGSTLTIGDATTDDRTFDHRVDGNSWHFMSLPTAIAFSSENFNFANSAGVQDANHGGGTFTGPALWSSDPAVYAQPSGGNGSHLDMLHGSPFSMGIAHEVDNVFWIYDDWYNDIVRYDFADDHGPGNDDHADGSLKRYQDIGIEKDGDIPNHMILDKNTGWLYFVDNGQDRVIRLDIHSATDSTDLALINEALEEHLSMTGYTHEVIINTGLDRPCGIEIQDNYLLVGDYGNGDIIVYDMDNSFQEMGRITTNNVGLTGIKIGPEGNLWTTNRIMNTLTRVSPSGVSATSNIEQQTKLTISPNPTSDFVTINIDELTTDLSFTTKVFNNSGQLIEIKKAQNNGSIIDVRNYNSGIYYLEIMSKDVQAKKAFVVQK